jgi:hypothetical protein
MRAPEPAPAQPADGLHGRFRDVVRDPDGRIRHDAGWRPNAIVTDFRRLLAGFVHGAPVTVTGITGLRVGAGRPEWDDPPGPPTPGPEVRALADPNPFTVARAELQLDFVDPVTGAPSAAPTRSVQIRASLGPNVPPWPDGAHATSTLREFGLVATLQGTEVLLNYRTHPAIAKDRASTLERTVWLVF